MWIPPLWDFLIIGKRNRCGSNQIATPRKASVSETRYYKHSPPERHRQIIITADGKPPKCAWLPFWHRQDHSDGLFIAFRMQRRYHHWLNDTSVFIHNKFNPYHSTSIQERVIRILGLAKQKGIQGIYSARKPREKLGK